MKGERLQHYTLEISSNFAKFRVYQGQVPVKLQESQQMMIEEIITRRVAIILVGQMLTVLLQNNVCRANSCCYVLFRTLKYVEIECWVVKYMIARLKLFPPHYCLVHVLTN